MRYLVTGGLGFIGTHLCAKLAAAGHEIVILDDLSTGKREQAPAHARIVIDDVSRPGVFSELLSNIDGCFHLAAIASVERSNTDWLRTHQVNLGGTVNLFAAIAQSQRSIPVVFASSAATYGIGGDTPLAESASAQPLSAYGADKLACEWHSRIATYIHRIPTIGLRFFNVYGPGQDPESPYSGVISIFAERLLRNQPLTINGDGKQSRDFIFVEDIVQGTLLAMQALQQGEQHHGIFNLCTGHATSILELVRTLSAVLGITPIAQHGPPRTGDARISIGSPALAASLLGFTAQTTLAHGLHATLAWFNHNS